MTLKICPVSNRRQLYQFIHLPAKIHSHHKFWVPPIYLDEWLTLSPRRNTAFSYCDTILALARKNGQVVGRVMGIINYRYNRLKNEKSARFSHLETHQDANSVGALLEYVENWARGKGMNKIIGPFGFSDLDPEGFLVDGFDQRATIATYYNYEWMPRLVAQHGYVKEIDYVTYKAEVTPDVPEMMNKIHKRIQKRNTRLELVEVHSKKEARQLAKPIFALMNECYLDSNIFGFAPMDNHELDFVLKRYLPLLDHRFLKGLKKGNEYVGFFIAIPDMTAGIQSSKGRLFPLGFQKILKARKSSQQLDLLLGGVKKECRGLGGEILMWMAMYKSAQQAGMKVIDSHHQMETNTNMRAASERLGGKVYKRYRIFGKWL